MKEKQMGAECIHMDLAELASTYKGSDSSRDFQDKLVGLL